MSAATTGTEAEVVLGCEAHTCDGCGGACCDYRTDGRGKRCLVCLVRESELESAAVSVLAELLAIALAHTLAQGRHDRSAHCADCDAGRAALDTWLADTKDTKEARPCA